MDGNAHEEMLEKNERLLCPFRGSWCAKEQCAMWHQRINDRGNDVSKCGFLMASYALVHLATVGMDVYPE